MRLGLIKARISPSGKILSLSSAKKFSIQQIIWTLSTFLDSLFTFLTASSIISTDLSSIYFVVRFRYVKQVLITVILKKTLELPEMKQSVLYEVL